MTTKPFEIRIVGSGEVIGELESEKVAHRIAHLFLEEWPEFAPLAVKDRVHRTTRLVQADTCGFADCEPPTPVASVGDIPERVAAPPPPVAILAPLPTTPPAELGKRDRVTGNADDGGPPDPRGRHPAPGTSATATLSLGARPRRPIGDAPGSALRPCWHDGGR